MAWIFLVVKSACCPLTSVYIGEGIIYHGPRPESLTGWACFLMTILLVFQLWIAMSISLCGLVFLAAWRDVTLGDDPVDDPPG